MLLLCVVLTCTDSSVEETVQRSTVFGFGENVGGMVVGAPPPPRTSLLQRLHAYFRFPFPVLSFPSMYMPCVLFVLGSLARRQRSGIHLADNRDCEGRRRRFPGENLPRLSSTIIPEPVVKRANRFPHFICVTNILEINPCNGVNHEDLSCPVFVFPVVHPLSCPMNNRYKGDADAWCPNYSCI